MIEVKYCTELVRPVAPIQNPPAIPEGGAVEAGVPVTHQGRSLGILVRMVHTGLPVLAKPQNTLALGRRNTEATPAGAVLTRSKIGAADQ